jgi:site-specific DNA-methyltransferase (adenine-specific)
LQIVEIQNWINKNSNLIFKQLIVWNKRFDGARNKDFMDGFVVVEGLRNYQKMVEYCLYYTFQDETGLSKVKSDTANFANLRKYFYDLLCFMGERTGKGVNDKLGHRKAGHSFYCLPKKQVIDEIGQRADHCFRYGSSQWDLPTKEVYDELIRVYDIDKWEGFREYESLREEYESLRYTFNNQKTHHSVWNYEVAKKIGHVTPKPVELIENIIKHSSNEGDVVLDCFMGSGTTAVACENLNRHWIGIERKDKYCEIIKNRLKNFQGKLF